MRARTILVVLCLGLVAAATGCSLLDGGETQAGMVDNRTVEPTLTLMATIPTAPPETPIASDGSLNVVATVKASDSLSTMGELLDAAGLAAPISAGKRSYTLFVPTDSAFEKLPPGWLDKLKDPANVEKLRRLLRYHLVQDKVPSEQMYNIRRVMTYEGGILMISRKGSVGYVNGKVKLLQTDVRAKNGTLHIVDTVLIPRGFAL